MGKKNQLYAKWVRLLPNPDNPNEVYLVLAKDAPMDKKYIKQFDNMFAGKDVLITIGTLIRGKKKASKETEKAEEEEEETQEKENFDFQDSPFWSAQP